MPRCLVVTWGFLLLFPFVGHAETFTFRLEYRDSGFRHRMPVMRKDTLVFKKEPALKGKKVVRGALLAGRDRDDFLGLACDKEARILYLDLNGNLDLTDDVEASYSGTFEDGWLPSPHGSSWRLWGAWGTGIRTSSRLR